jgi:hypothetical protein
MILVEDLKKFNNEFRIQVYKFGMYYYFPIETSVARKIIKDLKLQSQEVFISGRIHLEWRDEITDWDLIFG